jgi:hypothetical protein
MRRKRRPLIEPWLRPHGLAETVFGMEDQLRDIQLSEREGDVTQQVFVSGGGSSGGGGGGAHPDLATHDALGLATDAELAAHTGDTSDAHDASAISILDAAGDFTATDVEGALAELQADAEAHVAAADPHTGYVREADANWVDLTDGGATTLHSHAGGGGSALTVQEFDGSPEDNAVTLIRVPNNGLIVNGAGDVSLHYVPSLLGDAKGDLIVFVAGDTPARIAVGVNGTMPMADSAQSVGLLYANPVIRAWAFGG